MVTCCRTGIAQSRVDTAYPCPPQRRKNGRYSWNAGEMQCGKPSVLRRWVDIHLNPKIGADWQLRGQQKRVFTPGQNENYYLAGALHSGTGKVSNIGGNSKSLSLFIRILKHLKATCRRAKKITLIVDNYIIQKAVKRCAGWKQIRSSGWFISQFTRRGWIMSKGCGRRFMRQ